jgi:hypothetical protein
MVMFVPVTFAVRWLIRSKTRSATSFGCVNLPVAVLFTVG